MWIVRYAGLCFMLFYTTVYAQYNFDSIKICHSNNELKRIVAGEYEVKMKERQLFSLTSADSAVNYEADKKMFIFKNLIKGGTLTIKLLAEGVIGIDEIKGAYTWGIVIGSEDKRNRLLLSYIYENPSMLDISDSKNKIGVRLIAEKGSAVFTTLYGTRVFGDQMTATKEYLIKYSGKGILRKSKGFILACD